MRTHKLAELEIKYDKALKKITELEAKLKKWRDGENISRAAIGLFVHDYNEWQIEENRRDYMIRDEDVEGFFDNLEPGDDEK